MKNEQPKKVEIEIGRKRHLVSAAAAKIAIDTMGANEVVPFGRPNQLKIKPPPIIAVEPIYKNIEVPDIKSADIKLVDIKPEPVKTKTTRTKKK